MSNIDIAVIGTSQGLIVAGCLLWLSCFAATIWDDIAQRIYAKRHNTYTSTLPYDKDVQQMEGDPRTVARREYLTLLAEQQGFSRRWYERIPRIGDWMLRKRLNRSNCL
jgi:hypothetical protein